MTFLPYSLTFLMILFFSTMIYRNVGLYNYFLSKTKYQINSSERLYNNFQIQDLGYVFIFYFIGIISAFIILIIENLFDLISKRKEKIGIPISNNHYEF